MTAILVQNGHGDRNAVGQGQKWTVGGKYLNYVDVDIEVALQGSSRVHITY